MKILNGITLTGSAVLDSNSLIVGTTQLVASSGKIGIGTSAPSTELHIVDSNPELLRLERTGGFGNAAIGASSLGSMVFFGKPQIGSFAVGASFDLTSSPYLTIASNGNIGIGAGSTPASKLQVSGGDVLLDNNANLLFKTAAGGTVSTINVTTANNLQINSLATNQYYASTNHQFYTSGGTERMRITSGGSIAIGATTATAKLDVVGEIRTSDKFGYGASAYTQYNSTTKSIDFIFV